MQIPWIWLLATLALGLPAAYLIVRRIGRSRQQPLPVARFSALPSAEVAPTPPPVMAAPPAPPLLTETLAPSVAVPPRRFNRESAERAKQARMASSLRSETTTPLPAPLPREQALALAVATARMPAEPVTPPHSKLPPLVLVVDDAKTVRVKIGRLLQTLDLRLVYAVDGDDALRQLSQWSPDLLITDMDMPGLDGLALTRALRAMPHTALLPVIMVSAADERHQQQAREAGVTVLLGKPFGDAVLLQQVHDALAMRRGGILVPLPEPILLS